MLCRTPFWGWCISYSFLIYPSFVEVNFLAVCDGGIAVTYTLHHLYPVTYQYLPFWMSCIWIILLTPKLFYILYLYLVLISTTIYFIYLKVFIYNKLRPLDSDRKCPFVSFWLSPTRILLIGCDWLWREASKLF